MVAVRLRSFALPGLFFGGPAPADVRDEGGAGIVSPKRGIPYDLRQIYPSAKVIAFTGSNSFELQREIRIHGVVSYMTKPKKRADRKERICFWDCTPIAFIFMAWDKTGGDSSMV
jgi:hypothetical protein